MHLVVGTRKEFDIAEDVRGSKSSSHGPKGSSHT